MGSINIRVFQKKLLDWYNANKRDLPFRKTKDPYQVWLSEIMAQQTTMPVVVDYFKRFVKKFPDVTSVANASEHDLLVLWQGLGYYARCRHFHRACKDVVQHFGGKVPQTYDELRTLKGTGVYTAAAIASICFDEPRAVIDGNVKRVIARVFYYDKTIVSVVAQRFIRNRAEELLDRKHPGDFNQAMMELGALVCGRQPLCAQCPVAKLCQGKTHRPERLPISLKTKYHQKQFACLILKWGDALVLKTPAPDSLIAGLWELPTLYDIKGDLGEKEWQSLLGCSLHAKHLALAGQVRHSITNQRIVTRVYVGSLPSSSLTKRGLSGFKMISRSGLSEIPLNALTRKILQKYFV